MDLSLRFAETERLPITVSVGIATYPDHGTSVTTLLAGVVRVLEEAKASGGDTVRDAADRSEDDAAAGTSFDVLQGLVIAVDTKDRYTKRHTEDVARYATFLARRIDMPADEIRTLAVAGLLHDIGRSVSRTGSCASRATDRSRVRHRQAARRTRRHDRPRPAGRRGGPGWHPAPPRTVGRAGLPRSPRGRGHPAHRADPGRGRRLPRR